jgi:hypothetical protein
MMSAPRTHAIPTLRVVASTLLWPIVLCATIQTTWWIVPPRPPTSVTPRSAIPPLELALLQLLSTAMMETRVPMTFAIPLMEHAATLQLIATMV